MAFKIAESSLVHPSAKINVKEGFIGERAIIRDNVVVEGERIEIGHEAYLDSYAHIGGGSCFNPDTRLVVGDFLHMGRFSHINFAEPVTIGHEFGCGIGTKVFAHGAYPPATEGFPVQWAPVTIGDRVWMPHAWVNPGVHIGNNIVIAAMSLVNISLPDGCFAGGIPVRILREDAYPEELSFGEKFEIIKQIMCKAMEQDAAYPHTGGGLEHQIYIGELDNHGGFGIVVDDTIFDTERRTIEGPANVTTEIVKNQLRRNGIRFRYHTENGEYVPWKD